ncbi:MAG: thioredoxin family protein [Bacteroidales bacterium]|nr:thioredoxin family protein [Bacteroidales bacterium]
MNRLNEYINSGDGVMLYFFSNSCQACLSLRPKIREMAEAEFPAMEYIEIDAQASPEVTAEASVFTAPVIIIYFEGREYIRESRYISVGQLQEKIRRYYEMVFGT